MANDFQPLVDANTEAKMVAAVAAIDSYVGLMANRFSEDTVQRLQDRIAALGQAVGSGLPNIGQLLYQQAERPIVNVDPGELANGVENAQHVVQILHDFKQTGQPYLVDQADTLSATATSFLKMQSDPYYLGGLLIVGSVRLDAIRAKRDDYFNDAGLKAEIDDLADHIAAMTSVLRQQVGNKHVIGQGVDQVAGTDPKGRPAEFNVWYVAHMVGSMRFSSYYIGTTKPPGLLITLLPPAVGQAKASADRDAGIADELAYMTVPSMESVAAAWRARTGPQN
jgi:hypothetical protein